MFLTIPFTAILLAAAVCCNVLIDDNDFHKSNKSFAGNLEKMVGGVSLYHVNSSFGSGPMVYGNITAMSDEDGMDVAVANGNFTSFGLVDENPSNAEQGLNNSSVIVGTVANLKIKGDKNYPNGSTIKLSAIDQLISRPEGQIVRGRKMQFSQHTKHGTKTNFKNNINRRLSKKRQHKLIEPNSAIHMTKKEREMAMSILRAKMEKIEHDIPRLNLALHILDRIYERNKMSKRDHVKAPPMLALLTLADNILNTCSEEPDPVVFGTDDLEFIINKVERSDGNFFDRKSNQTLW